jgi:hypothetical protein
LSDFITSTLDYLTPSLEHNIMELDEKKGGLDGHRKRDATMIETKNEVSTLICWRIGGMARQRWHRKRGIV